MNDIHFAPHIHIDSTDHTSHSHVGGLDPHSHDKPDVGRCPDCDAPPEHVHADWCRTIATIERHDLIREAAGLLDLYDITHDPPETMQEYMRGMVELIGRVTGGLADDTAGILAEVVAEVEAKATTIDTPEGVIYEPWTNGYSVGFKAIKGDRVEYVYLNPSSETDDGQPNIFLYQGTSGDPNEDTPWHHYNVFEENS